MGTDLDYKGDLNKNFLYPLTLLIFDINPYLSNKENLLLR